jgi:polysaccharide biosynthesis/export protein
MKTSIPLVLLPALFSTLLSAQDLPASSPPAGTAPSASTPANSEKATPDPGNTAPETDPLKLAKPNSAGEKILGGAPIDPNAYVIGAEDVLSVFVWHDQELTRQVVVRPDGKITLPLVGELEAAGLTLPQLTTTIASGLKKYMVSPEVNVSVQAVNSKKFYIQGEVMRPGSYPLIVPTTVLEGLANAGGFRDFANIKKIVVMRGSERFHFNYKEVRSGKHLEQNILLRPGDEIFVP